jgi:undecaprenyl-diphosphatase
MLAYVNAQDLRVSDRVYAWTPPRWFRAWMIGASRLGDGWLWLLTGLLLLDDGSSSARRTLAAIALVMGIANVALVALKRRFPRPRPCDVARHPAFDMQPLRLIAVDRFSFPSGHALNAFAVCSVVGLSFTAFAPALVVVAVSVGASRVVMGLHFVSDVLAGALLGVLIGGLVFLAVLA